MTSKLTITDDKLSGLLSEMEKSFTGCQRHGYTDAAEEYDDMISALRELQERRKAAMDSEPVADVVAWSHPTEERTCDISWRRHDVEPGPLYRHAQPAKGLELAGWQFKSVNGDWLGLIDEHGKNQAVREGCEVREVFAMADGVNDRDQVRSEHAEWSQATFGNVGPVGPLKHLSKEALEAAAEPDDLSEWADLQFLLWDAQRRAGITDEQITLAMIEKLAVNKQREWPEPKDGEPRLHIKEQPAPVVPDEKPMPNPLNMYAVDAVAAIAEVRGWNACRAAMLQADTFIGEGAKMPSLKCLEDVKFNADCAISDPESIYASEFFTSLDEVFGEKGNYKEPVQAKAVSMLIGEVLRLHNYHPGNSPVIPEGYVMVPKEPTVEILAVISEAIRAMRGSAATYARVLAAAPQEVKGE